MEKQKKKIDMNWKFLLSEEQIKTMREEIFKNRESIHQILIPKDFMIYLSELEETAYNKAHILVMYVGIILTYTEAYHTYRKHHMNLEIISQLMGIKYSNVVRKQFTRESYLDKKDFIGYQADYPVKYNYSYYEHEDSSRHYFKEFVMKKSLSDEELNKLIPSSRHKVNKSIEPVRHTKGILRKRGRGYQVIAEPLNKVADKYITVDYRTLKSLVDGELSPQAFHFACVVKDMLGNKKTTPKSKFRTSKEQLANKIGTSKDTIKRYSRELKNYTNGKYYLEQISYLEARELKSIVYLHFECVF